MKVESTGEDFSHTDVCNTGREEQEVESLSKPEMKAHRNSQNCTISLSS